jgi:vesicle-fusing ATPase
LPAAAASASAAPGAASVPPAPPADFDESHFAAGSPYAGQGGPWNWRPDPAAGAPERERDAQGRALHPRVGAPPRHARAAARQRHSRAHTARAGAAAGVPLHDPRWAAPSAAAPAEPAAKAPPLSANAFSAARLRDLGIGGLDAELASLFRRAFASRATPPTLAAAMGVSHVKGLLLHGPPGTGKTLVARRLGALLSSGREPRVVNGPELLARWVGSSEENVRLLFADAEADWARNGDAADLHVIIFDEIDALCRHRGSGGSGGGGNSVGDSVVNQLLTKMDGVSSAPNVLVIGLTNRRDLLDEALLRPGRLEVQLEIGLPDEAGRAAILSIHTAAMKAAGLLGADVDIGDLAAQARNFSGAELAGVVRAAASFAMERLLRRSPQAAGDTSSHGAHGRGLGLGEVSVTPADFAAALAEVAPALGAKGGAAALLAQHAPRGVLAVGARLAAVRAQLATLTRAAERGAPATPLVSALLHGAPGAGKTALAAEAAAASGFPFARVVVAAPDAAAAAAAGPAGGGGDALATALVAAFSDASRSPHSVLVLDDIERLIGFSPVGPAYSNAALQALLLLLRRPPPAGRRLLVLATTSQPEAMDALGVSAAFGAALRVPLLAGDERAAALTASGAFTDAQQAAQAAALLADEVAVKHLLQLLDLARAREDAPGGAAGHQDAKAAPKRHVDVAAFKAALREFAQAPQPAAKGAASARRDQ